MTMLVTTPNIEAERRCLSSLMKSAKDAYAAVAAGLSADQFTSAKHKAVFAAICAASAELRDTGLECVWGQLTTLDGKSPVSMEEMVEIDGSEGTSMNRAVYVEAVIASARKRSLLAAIHGAEEAAKADATSWEEIWDAVSPHLEKAQATTAGTSERSISDICANVRREIIEPEKRKTVPTGLAGWDQVAGALRAGELICGAARPGCGKTALAVQIALYAAKRGQQIAFFSLEMSGEELVNRMALVRAGNDGLRYQEKLLTALDDVSQLKTFHIFDNQEPHTLASIESRCRLLNTMPGGLSLIVIDYLQLVEPADIRAPREQQVAQMSRRFKKLAGALKCPIILLAQLNRESEKEERRPRLSDLRESGAIEQDSDRVWFLWNDPKNLPKMQEEPSEIDVTLIQAKCRGGRPNVATMLKFNRPIFTFTPIKQNP